jgi:hypothetical protein
MSIQNYQINQFAVGKIALSGISVTSNLIAITSNLATACNTAGNGGISVPFQASSGVSNEGFVTTTINNTTNQVQVFAHSTLSEILDSNGNQVYGRLTYASNVYTVNFYNGSENTRDFSHGMTATTVICRTYIRTPRF